MTTKTLASRKRDARAKRSFVMPVELVPEADGSYTAVVPLLTGCVTWGRTWTEALTRAKEAAELCIEVLLEDGDKVPETKSLPSGPTIVAEV